MAKQTEEITREERLELLYEPCRSKEDLRNHIKYFLNIDLPNYTVDELSNSNAMDFVWNIYYSMLTGTGATRVVVAASRNSAKCLAEGTQVATPKGPTEIQNLKIGDFVFDENGNQVQVMAVFDQGEQDCVDLYRGRTKLATCTPGHVWLMSEDRKPNDWIQKKIQDVKKSYRIKRVDLTLPLGSKSEPLAYALGALLGDGCSTECGVRISSKNDLIPQKVAKLLGTDFLKLRSNNYSYLFHAPQKNRRWVFSDFYEKNIRNKRSYEKTADLEEIKTWDRTSLLAFVAGILDTDGSVFYKQNQIYIKIGMQSRSVMEAIQYAFLALWQIDIPMDLDNRPHYVHGPMYMININNVYFCKKALRELDDYLVIDSKKYKPTYDLLEPNNFNPLRSGFIVKPAGIKHCWDITVDSPTSLYCLQNGLVTHNTLTACLIRFYGMIHCRRSGTHLAAVKTQSDSATAYLNKMLRIDGVREHLTVDNTRDKKLENLPANSFTKNSECELRIAVATLSGVNSQRGSLNTKDEIDLINPAILTESSFISDPTRDEHQFNPIEIYLSSRKTNSGPVQKMLDEADRSGVASRLAVFKWSWVDWMRKCKDNVAKIDKPLIARMNMETLKVVWDDKEFGTFSESEVQLFHEIRAFDGCRNCPAFIACQGRAVKQKSTSPMLRTVEFIADRLQDAGDASAIIAQGLNLRPESSAVVFRLFNRRVHFLKNIEFYKWCIGDYYVPENVPIDEVQEILQSQDPSLLALISPTKSHIYAALRTAGWKIHYGVDYGSVDPAVCLVVGYHKPSRRMIILHTEASTGFPNDDWAKHIKTNIWPVFPCDLVCPDMADINSPIYFGRLSIPCHDKKPARIEPGVSQIRSFLWNPASQHSHFAMLDDGDFGLNKWVAECFEKWTYKKVIMGYDYKRFEDNEYTHPCDSLRYAADPWIADMKVVMASSQPKTELQTEMASRMGDPEAHRIRQQKEALKQQIKEYFGAEHGLSHVFDSEERLKTQDLSPTDQRGWSPMAADKKSFVKEDIDPNLAEPLSRQPKGRIRFKF